MSRYVIEAFLARPALGGLPRIPWNLLGVAAIAALGFLEPRIWIGGAFLEVLYLLLLSTNLGFRQWVDDREKVRALRAKGEETDEVAALPGAARERIARLQEKIARVESLYRAHREDDLLVTSNVDALRRLAAIFVRLLVAQKALVYHATPEAELRRQVAEAEHAVNEADASPALRESKRATLGLLEQRLRNLERRDEVLAEIESDLGRIEAQVDLALEDAALDGTPGAVTGNIRLVSQLLDEDLLDPDLVLRRESEREV